MQIRDSLTLDASGLSRTSDGYLQGAARISRAGNVQRYLGSEIGLTGDDAGKVFGVYRDPDVVFDEASMLSLAGRPVTRGHPPEGVNSQTWKDLSVGSVGGRVIRDGEHVVAHMAIMDATAADEVESGARSLSAGYTTNIVKDEGTAPDGTAYQYRQAEPLRFNHVAYLPDNNPRAGNTRIGDSHWGARPIDRASSGANGPLTTTSSSTKGNSMSDALRTVMLDGLSVKTTDEGAAAITKLQDALAASQSEVTDAEAEVERLKKANEEKDGEIKAKDKALADATSPQAIADAVKARTVATDAGKKAGLSDEAMASLSDADIRRAVVAKALGDETAKAMSDDAINGAFAYASKAAPMKTGDAAFDGGVKQPLKDGETGLLGAARSRYGDGK